MRTLDGADQSYVGEQAHTKAEDFTRIRQLIPLRPGAVSGFARLVLTRSQTNCGAPGWGTAVCRVANQSSAVPLAALRDARCLTGFSAEAPPTAVPAPSPATTSATGAVAAAADRTADAERAYLAATGAANDAGGAGKLAPMALAICRLDCSAHIRRLGTA